VSYPPDVDEDCADGLHEYCMSGPPACSCPCHRPPGLSESQREAALLRGKVEVYEEALSVALARAA
jgi:hypothetical protein